jgi:FlgD Ig-like domain
MQTFVRTLFTLLCVLILTPAHATAATPARASSVAFQLPAPIGLPYVQTIRIGRPTPCLECPPIVCPWQPIPVGIGGTFPTPCIALEGIRLVPSPETGPRPVPPIVEILASQHDCAPCARVIVPWTGEVELPALPPGPNSLIVRLRVHHYLCDTLATADSLYSAAVAFTVLDSCAPPPAGDSCFLALWQHADSSECDAFVAPEHAASVTLGIRTGVPLAGFQGSLQVDPPGLKITQLEAVGPASGMHLSWSPTELGARFVMFADQGAPISPDLDSTGTLLRLVPVLRVTVALPPGMTAPEVTYVWTGDLLASDSTGREVSQCFVRDTRFAVTPARICAAHGCDVNHDGVADVRDLVLLVHCVMGTGPCPDAAGAGLDCNHDGALSLDDVLCCARVVLHVGGSDSLPGRPEPNVHVGLGTPIRTATGVDLPVRVSGANRLGAARLVLQFPSERFDVSDVELRSQMTGWMSLHEVEADRLELGLIGLQDIRQDIGQFNVDLVVHFALRDGQTADGNARLVDGEFSGPDGATVTVAMMQSPAPLVPRGLELSPGRPNPFGRETRFAVTLAAPAAIDVGVFDLHGRHLATLAKGTFAAGTREFSWDGTLAGGERASDGLYFVVVRSGAERRTEKLMLLRGR